MSYLKVENLSCRYEEKPVLDKVSFSVNSGESVAIVGPSGSGKTTLAYCLSGIIPNKVRCEVDGRILLDGWNVIGRDLKEIVKRVNVVMQNYEIQIFGLTVEEDITFGLENLMLEEEETNKRLEWALKSFGLSGYRGYYVSRLSGGLKQRLAIASTVVMQPDFLVMDDPASNLDWKGVKGLRSIVDQLKKQGKGVIITARRIKGLEGCIDRILKLANGTIKECDKEYGRNTWPPKWTYDDKTIKDGPCSVKIEDLWFRYSDRYVLRGVQIDLYPGEVVAIMGPNGSGKTTLAKHINGLLKPTKGRVTVMGKDTKRYSAAELAKYVGFVFQDSDRHLTFETIWDEVTFGCKNLGLSLDEAERALRALGLYEKKERPPYSLSMGEKVRLMMAAALAMDPKVLVLDEPTTGQDDRTLKAIEGTMAKMKDEGRCTIMVTHDSDFALRVSDRIIVIREGTVVADAPPSGVLLNEEFVEKFELEPPTGPLPEVRA